MTRAVSINSRRGDHLDQASEYLMSPVVDGVAELDDHEVALADDDALKQITDSKRVPGMRR